MIPLPTELDMAREPINSLTWLARIRCGEDVRALAECYIRRAVAAEAEVERLNETVAMLRSNIEELRRAK